MPAKNKNDLDFLNDEIEEDEEDIEPEEDVITTPFDPSEIRVDTRPMTIDLILDRIQYEEIDLAPDFQRHANIWTDVAQSKLIESILIRIPLPAFYIDATNEDKWLVIDGLQRLSSLKKFVIDKNLKLLQLEFLRNLEGKYYEELSRNYQRRIKETVLTIYLIEKGTPEKVKFNIFRRINTGGLPLSPQELRHAMNPGKANNFLDKLAKSFEFRQATQISTKRQKRMEDHEFILGFIAFLLTHYDHYPVKEGRDYFLNEAMKKINKMSCKELEIIEENFKKAMNIAYDIFEDSAFRKIIRSNIRKQQLNKSLFESWSFHLNQLDNRKIELLKQRKETVKDIFADYIENDESFLKSISQASYKISYRFQIIGKIIQKALSQ